MEINIGRKDCQICSNMFCEKRETVTECEECITELQKELILIDKKLENIQKFL